jgi:ribosomal protein S18 acetylase RimI-like enzyme
VRALLEMDGVDPATTTLGAFVDDVLIGSAFVWDMDEQHVQPMVRVLCHPAHIASEVPHRLLEFVRECAAAGVSRAPSDARVAALMVPWVHGTPLVRLFTESGWQELGYELQMAIDLADPPESPPLPPGLRLAAVGEVDPRRVWEAGEEVFRDHHGYVPTGFDAWRQVVVDVNRSTPDLWLLALEGDDIAGFCLNALPEGPEGGRGYVASLGVRRPWRRRGLGLALLRHAFALLYERGARRIELDVDADSLTGATRLYERAGMRRQRTTVLHSLEIRPGREMSVTALT